MADFIEDELRSYPSKESISKPSQVCIYLNITPHTFLSFNKYFVKFSLSKGLLK